MPADFHNAKLKYLQGKEIKSRMYMNNSELSNLQEMKHERNLSMPKIALNNNFLHTKLDKLKKVKNVYIGGEQPIFVKFERFGKNFD